MADQAPLLERAFMLDVHEDSYAIDLIQGKIPEFVRGTYYLNGPARFERQGLRYRHWLDGDGMVCALRFESGRVRFTNRFIRTRKFLTEEAAGRPVFRTFGTAFAGDRLKRGVATESPVNVSVYPYRRSLLAFGESTLPYELDPVTLETRGPFDFDNQLNELSPFGAHPKLIPATGELFNFGLSFSATEPCLTLYHFGGDGSLIYRKRVLLPYPCAIHDFSLSPTYAVFYLSPYLLNLATLLREGRTTMDALSWQPQLGSRLLILARETGDAVGTVPIGRGYCLHLINGFEEGGRLIIDVVEFERPMYDQYQPLPDLFQDVPEGRPTRFVVDLHHLELIQRSTLDYCLAPDFPSVDPRLDGRPYNAFWMLGISATGQKGRKFFDQLVHADWRQGCPGDIYRSLPGQYLGGEPIFIANPEAPMAGAVISQLFNAHEKQSAFAIFDAFNVGQGPVATLRLRAPVPPGFHASFRAGP